MTAVVTVASYVARSAISVASTADSVLFHCLKTTRKTVILTTSAGGSIIVLLLSLLAMRLRKQQPADRPKKSSAVQRCGKSICQLSYV